MLIGDSVYRNVLILDEKDLKPMRDYLLGAVKAWCKDRKEQWFAARDILGGANYYWQGTPLYKLFEYYRDHSNQDVENAVTQAGRSAGHLLKRVLIEDKKRNNETRVEYTRQYRWVGDENIDE